MTQNAVWQLSVARANSMFGSGFAALAVEGAVAGLVAGLDGQALRELAGMSRSSRDEDVMDLLEPALREAGVRVQMSTADAQVVYLRGIAIEVILGRASVRSLTSWAHEVIGHEGAEVLQDIVELDDELDLADGGVIAKIDARPIIESFLRASLPLVERLIAVDEDPA